MPDGSGGGVAAQISAASAEAAKIVVGAIAVWAWRFSQKIGGLDPRVLALEAAALEATNYADATKLEAWLAEQSARFAAALEVERAARSDLETQVRELQRNVARIEGATGIGTPVGGVPIGAAPADRGSNGR